jgi:H+-transporting ATPase
MLAAGKYALHLGLPALRTLCLVILISSGQASLYVVRERRHLWSSLPSRWLLAASCTDLLIIATLSTRGILMTRLPAAVVFSVFAAAAGFGVLLDLVKVPVFRRLSVV